MGSSRGALLDRSRVGTPTSYLLLSTCSSGLPEVLRAVTRLYESTRFDLDGNTDLWDPATIRQFLSQFHTLLKGVCADSKQRAGEISLLDKAGRRLLAEWNGTRTAYPLDRCVHQMFEAQAERVPDSLAVLSADGQLPTPYLLASRGSLASELAAHAPALPRTLTTASDHASRLASLRACGPM